MAKYKAATLNISSYWRKKNIIFTSLSSSYRPIFHRETQDEAIWTSVFKVIALVRGRPWIMVSKVFSSLLCVFYLLFFLFSVFLSLPPMETSIWDCIIFFRYQDNSLSLSILPPSPFLFNLSLPICLKHILMISFTLVTNLHLIELDKDKSLIFPIVPT